jgi:hypothetical protein
VAQFLKVTHLSGHELKELLYQDLSQTAKDKDAVQETVKAAEFFINFQLNGYASLDEGALTIVWHGPTDSIPEAWFDRINRFIRLSQKIGLSFTDLDLILRSCCQNQLDQQAIETIAVIRQICDRYEIAIDVVCGFFSPMNTLGIGNAPEPKDLFNRVFNLKFAPLDRKYIAIPGHVPASYGRYTALTCSDDILAVNNKEYRKRLQQALNISERDLSLIVNRFRSRSPVPGDDPFNQEMGLPTLSLLFRLTHLVEILDLSYEDLFHLFDILGKDPAIRLLSTFNILIHHPPQEQDCYKIIAGNDIAATMWLVQVLCAVAQWLQTNDFTAIELHQWLTGADKNETEAAKSKQQKIAFLNNLYQQFKPVMFNASIFESDAVDRRSARIIHRTLIQDSLLVASQDHRLINDVPALVEPSIYQGLTQFDQFSSEDFIDLGLEQKLLDKIFSQLILKDYINTDRKIIEERFPAAIAQFQLETDFATQREELFALIHQLLMDATEADDQDATVELAIYPSDLETLEALSASHRDELYDNLIFNGYIDEEGNILQTDFFRRTENVDDFIVSPDLSIYSAPVWNQILAQTKQFDQEILTLGREIFAELPLKDFEIDDLLENLKFNEYINANYEFLNKRKLLAETPKTFNLALAFYPHRQQILKVIQASIQVFKSRFYTLNQEMFSALANQSVAQKIYQEMADSYLKSGILSERYERFFLDSDNIGDFVLSSYFTPNDRTIVFQAIQRSLLTARKYQFTAKGLEDLDFDRDEQAEIMAVLVTNGHLDDRGKLPWDKVSYFLNIDNALQFNLVKFEDYNKDIFFAIHAIAKVINTDVKALAGQFQRLAADQARVLFEALQDHFGVEVAVMQTICRHVWQNSGNIVAEFLLPLLAVVDTHDGITVEPNHHKFNLAYRRIGQFAAIALKLSLNRHSLQRPGLSREIPRETGLASRHRSL